MMFTRHVDYPPCFVSSKFDFTIAYFLCEKNGVEQIVRPRPLYDEPVTLMCAVLVC